MGRRRKTRKRRILKPPKKLPKIFTCPNCSSPTNVVTNKKEGKVKVICGSCGLEAEFNLVDGLLPVDYYNKFVDLYYKGIIKPKKEVIVSLEELKAMVEESTQQTETTVETSEIPVESTIGEETESTKESVTEGEEESRKVAG